MTKPKASEKDKAIGSRLKLLRELSGKSRAELAVFVNVSHQQIQKYETGENRVSAIRLKELADAMNLPIEIFYRLHDQQMLDMTKRKKPELDLQKMTKRIPQLDIRMCLIALVEAIERANKQCL